MGGRVRDDNRRAAVHPRVTPAAIMVVIGLIVASAALTGCGEDLQPKLDAADRDAAGLKADIEEARASTGDNKDELSDISRELAKLSESPGVGSRRSSD